MVTCHMFMFDLGFSTSPQQLLSLKVKIGSLGLTHENIRKTHSKDKDQCIYISLNLPFPKTQNIVALW